MTATDTPVTQARTAEQFAGAVREALDDLPPDEVDELTDGLEADLLDAAEEASFSGDFGDPAAYADELRAAAGFDPRTADHSTRRRDAFAERLRQTGTNLLLRVRSTALGSGALDAALALRPVWWILRGWALYQVTVALFSTSNRGFELLPATAMRWAVLISALVVSVQWGRGRWAPRKWLRALRTSLSIVAGLALVALIPIAIGTAASSSTAYAYAEMTTDVPQPRGLAIDGQPVINIFAYGPDGELLRGVQLFDQDGHPLDLIGSDDPEADWTTVWADDGSETTLVRSVAVPGRRGWNVYPLDVTDYSDIDYTAEPNGSFDRDDVREARAPFARVQPLAEKLSTTDAPAPSASPSDVPTPTPSPTTP